MEGEGEVQRYVTYVSIRLFSWCLFTGREVVRADILWVYRTIASILADSSMELYFVRIAFLPNKISFSEQQRVSSRANLPA